MNITTTPVSVTAGQETPNVDLQLTVTPPAPSGILMGKVTDFSDGTPIEDAHVLAEGDITSRLGVHTPTKTVTTSSLKVWIRTHTP